MPGTKGMPREMKHRAFTYRERKFNQLGKSGLINHFKRKFDAEKIQDHFLKQDTEIQLKRAKAIARHLEEEHFEKRKDFIIPMVESILHLADYYDITNVEAFAMTLRMYKHLPKDSDEGIERLFQDVNKLRLTNWGKFMRILKEVS